MRAGITEILALRRLLSFSPPLIVRSLLRYNWPKSNEHRSRISVPVALGGGIESLLNPTGPERVPGRLLAGSE